MEKKANWHKAKHSLITKAKNIFWSTKNKGELKHIGEGGEKKKRREGKEEEEEEKRRREEGR